MRTPHGSPLVLTLFIQVGLASDDVIEPPKFEFDFLQTWKGETVIVCPQPCPSLAGVGDFIEGVVLLEITTDKNGKPIDVVVLESAGSEVLDSRAISHAQKRVFPDRRGKAFEEQYTYELAH